MKFGRSFQIVDMMTSSMIVTASYMALNFATSILIIWCNKLAYNSGFKWVLSLTVLHFFVTFLGLEICACLGMFPRKPLKILSVVPISSAFCGFVLCNNLSLQYNVVGMYQLMKVMTTPCIVCLQYFIYSISLPRNQLLALVPVCVGVAVATVSSIDINFWGLFWGIAGIISTSVYQIWVKTEQSSLQASSQQLLYYQAPVSACMLLCIIPFVEDVYGPEGLINFKWEPVVTGYVLLSACLAFLVNLSIYLVIGTTSPVSYNVLGHGKLCIILASGFLIFGDAFSLKIFAGVLMAFSGVVYYTHLKLQGQTMPSLTTSSSSTDSSISSINSMVSLQSMNGIKVKNTDDENEDTGEFNGDDRTPFISKQ